MQTLKYFPFFLLLLALFFGLHGAIENFGFMTFSEVLQTIFLIILALVACTSIVYFLCKDLLFAALITFFSSLWYLFFGSIQDCLKSFSFINRYIFLLPILMISTVFVAFFLKRKKSLQQKMAVYLNLLFLIFCIYDSIFIIGKLIIEKTLTHQTISLNDNIVKNKPNVYFLLFDEYPGYKSLADSFYFKNDFFYSELTKDSFSTLPIFSNYNMTPYSMSSILNMQYISSKTPSEVIDQKNLQERSKEIKNGKVFEEFSNMGYRINNYSIFDVHDQKSLGGNSFILGHDRLLTDKLLHNRLIKDIGWIFLTGKYSSSFFQNLYYGDVKNYNEKVEQLLQKKLTERDLTPQFVYAHFLIPHQPYFYDSLGNANALQNLEDDATLRNKIVFLSYLKFCNKKILNLEKSITKNDPSGIIILMSDHGFRYYNNYSKFEPLNFNNFCATRNFNSSISPDSAISNVNIFRLLFNRKYNQRISFLKDSICVLQEPKN